METLAQLDLTDYMKIATLVNDNTTNEPSTYEVEYEANGYHLFIGIEHEAVYRIDRGDYYTPPSVEVLGEKFDVISFECLDGEGNPMACDFQVKRLTDILN